MAVIRWSRAELAKTGGSLAPNTSASDYERRAYITAGGNPSRSLNDLRAASRLGVEEHAYWKGLSGLSGAYSLTDHMREVFRVGVGAPVGTPLSTSDLSNKYWATR